MFARRRGARFSTRRPIVFRWVGDVGFWQGAFRDAAAAGYEQARAAIEARQPWSVELLYADHEGGQRAITRFLALPVEHQIAAEPGDRQGQAGEANRAGSPPRAGTGASIARTHDRGCWRWPLRSRVMGTRDRR
jgi:hypothetical protein